ncbi:hypothetical protein C7R54_03145 [Achromobacter aloeverae]|uniref:Uncharacterized protein n=1 Tax=Achromobacter aloeverae TaxID=1750518 RepID=A0A4Q1HQS6_9BURK|nr:hypothetical protein C7R54_03145 [Achromobacter aloeverae]
MQSRPASAAPDQAQADSTQPARMLRSISESTAELEEAPETARLLQANENGRRSVDSSDPRHGGVYMGEDADSGMDEASTEILAKSPEAVLTQEQDERQAGQDKRKPSRFFGCIKPRTLE